MLFGSALWGLYWLPLRTLEQSGLGGLGAIVLIYSGATLGFAWLARGELRAWRGHGWRMLGIAASATVAGTAFSLGMIHGEVARVMILFYLSPIWAVLLGRVLLGERLLLVTLPALALAFLGASALLRPEGGWSAFRPLPADLLGLVAGLGFALTNLQLRAAAGMPASLKNLATCVLIAPVALVLIMVFEAPLQVPIWTLPVGLAVGSIWMTAMTAATQYGISRLPLQRSSVLLLFELVVGAISAALLAGEHLDGFELLGGSGVVAAGLLVVWPKVRVSSKSR